jgi:protein deglycase
MSKTVLVPIAEGIEEIEAVCIIDTLRRAGANVTVASVGKREVIASRGVQLVADALIADCVDETFDCIALPGGMPGAEHLRDSADLIAKLKEQKQAGKLYAAICAAPAVVLKHHGLLDGVKATCYPSMQDQLDRQFVSRDPVVVDGQCVTGQGPGVAIAFALKLLERLFDAETAKRIGRAMLVEL